MIRALLIDKAREASRTKFLDINNIVLQTAPAVTSCVRPFYRRKQGQKKDYGQTQSEPDDSNPPSDCDQYIFAARTYHSESVNSRNTLSVGKPKNFATAMSSDKESSDIESNVSDVELSDHQNGSRKRRKLSPESGDRRPIFEAPSRVSTLSRVQAKKAGPTPSAGSTIPPAAELASKEKATFASVNVAPWLIASLASLEIKRPTGIQKACIPEILKGRDCIGGSRTGTGKTVAFSVPIMQKWAEDPMGIYAVIIT